MTPTDLNLRILFWIILFFLGAQSEPLPQQSPEESPVYCTESHPDYDPEKCAAEEDPLHKWRRLQEERVAREAELEGKECTCLNPIENEDPEDPLHKSRKLQCERVCKDVSKPNQD